MKFNATRLEESECDYLLSIHIRRVDGLDIGTDDTDPVCCSEL